MRPDHLDGHNATLKNAVVKIFLRHLTGFNEIRIKRPQLNRAHHITDLVER